MNKVLHKPFSCFVTGTDTDAGKTLAACGLLAAARSRGLSTAAVKPVAAGVTDTPSGRCNEDALALMHQCSPALTLRDINPVCFDDPVAPHIAAHRAGVALTARGLAAHCQAVLARKADFTVIEGAGGWLVPVNDTETLADLAARLGVPVILVVGMRLGCLNHALLTAGAIRDRGLVLAGWIANRLDNDMPVYRENLEALENRLPAPLVGEIPRLDSPSAEKAAACLDLDVVLACA